MFTGIVSDIGTIVRLEDRGDLRARIRCAYPAAGIAVGASIACDGVCLTVVDRGPDGAEYLRADALCPPAPAEAAGWRRRIGWLTWEDIVAVVFPGGQPAFQHPDAEALRDFLRDRRLFK